MSKLKEIERKFDALWEELYTYDRDTAEGYNSYRPCKGKVKKFINKHYISRDEIKDGKTWYIEEDELVIKRGKWVIDRYKRHTPEDKKCSCGKPAKTQTADGVYQQRIGGLIQNHGYYCDKCFEEGLELEKEAMGYYDKTNKEGTENEL